MIGARNEEQLSANLGAVGWKLTPEQGAKLMASERPKTYPYWHQVQFGERNPFPMNSCWRLRLRAWAWSWQFQKSRAAFRVATSSIRRARRAKGPPDLSLIRHPSLCAKRTKGEGVATRVRSGSP